MARQITTTTSDRGATRERVAAVLREEILDGRLAPGVPLRTEAVMERLGVSNSPLREAFVQLAAEGLVEVERNRGVIVAPLTRDGATDLLRVGALLWDAGCRWIVPTLDSATTDSLKRIDVDFKLAVRSGDLSSAILDAERFQATLLGACPSMELVRSIEAVRPRLQRLERMLATLALMELHGAMHKAVLSVAGEPSVDDAADSSAALFTALTVAVETNPRATM